MTETTATRARRVLFLAPFPPRLDAPHGGARTIARLLTGLSGETRVALLALRATDEPPVDAAVRGRCDLVEEIPRVRIGASPARAWTERRRLLVAARSGSPWAAGTCAAAFAARLGHVVETWEPQVVQAEFLVMGQYLETLRRPPPARIVVEHDPEAAGSRATRVHRRLWSRFRRRVLSAADIVVTFTERDRAAVRELVPAAHVVRIPLAVDLPTEPRSQESERPTVLFFGNFVHPPNVEAARRLAESILPAVRSARPDAVLELVGAGAPAGLRAHDGVHVAGLVPDLAPFLERASLVAAPLRSGGGMRVKVLETLAAGKALVASPLAVEGLDVEDGVHFAAARDDAEFAARIVELLADPAARERLGREARRWALEHVSWSRTIEQYEALYATLVRISP